MSTEPVLGRIVQHAIDQVDFLPGASVLQHVTATTGEVAALCPVTAQPDLYTVTIDYAPSGRVIESKSLKLYLWKFRSRGISCEDLAATIAQELTDQLGVVVRARAVQQPRGGIVLDATASGRPPVRHGGVLGI